MSTLSFRSRLRVAAYTVLRLTGAFALAQYLTRHQLRILCYHGFSMHDEHEVAPVMFMKAETFARRLAILKRRRVDVVSLDEGVRRLRSSSLRNATTIITLDDGWLSNLTVGLPLLRRYGYPACIYVTTDHFSSATTVFNVAVGYMMLRTARQSFELHGVHPSVDGSYDLQTDREALAERLLKAMERSFPSEERQRFLPAFAAALGFDLEDVLRSGRFEVMTAEQMKTAHALGVDIQLHTHSHRLPDRDFDAVAAEIDANRQQLQAVFSHPLVHFCYPSGKFAPQHPEWLGRLGIESATTCEPGFNDYSQSPLLLNRYLDSESATDIEFEAEIAGVREIARQMRRLLRRAVALK